MTVICADELPGLPARPAWSPDGHRLKAVLAYSRGPERTWVYGDLRPTDGQALTMTASSRKASSTSGFCNRSGTPTRPVRSGSSPTLVQPQQPVHLELARGRPRTHHAFIPVDACWLNLEEGWWRIFRKVAPPAGCSFANPDDIAYATTLATSQLNSRAKPWISSRPASPTRRMRRGYTYIVRGIQH